MSFLQLIALFRRLDVRALLAFPDDIADGDAVRAWLTALLGAGEVLAEQTGTEVDDEIVVALAEILADDEAWETIHGLVVDIVTTDAVVQYEDGSYGSIVGEVDLDGVEEAADISGFSPTLILAIVQAVGILLNYFWQDTEEEAA